MDPNMDLHITEITDPNDDLLLPWLDLYEVSFPPNERMLVSFYLRLLREQWPNHHLLAIQREGTFVGLAHYVVMAERDLTWLWMFAVTPESRNHGVGAAIYRNIVERLPVGTVAMLLEVERPEGLPGTQAVGHLRVLARHDDDVGDRQPEQLRPRRDVHALRVRRGRRPSS